jgi:hypothetical protein
LLLTGLRLGELTHLLLPDDLNLNAAVLRLPISRGWTGRSRRGTNATSC